MHPSGRAGCWDPGARVKLLEEHAAGHQGHGPSLGFEEGLVSSFMWASTVATTC